MTVGLWLALAWAVGASAPSDVTPPVLDPVSSALLQRREYEDVRISPDGELIAFAHHDDAGSTVEVSRRSDFRRVTTITIGGNGEVAWMHWQGPQRILVATQRTGGPFSTPMGRPTLYLLTLGERRAKVLPGGFLGVVDNDETHALVQRCRRWQEGGCVPEVRRVGIDRVLGGGDQIVLAPGPNVDFSIDHDGNVRFADRVDDDARQRLYVREGEQWRLINDSDNTGVYVTPLAIARDNASAFLAAEQKQGPDTVERYDFATGTRTVLLRDRVSDPLAAVYSLDGREPVGAVFGLGRPVARYWDPGSEESRQRQAIADAFPDDTTTIVNASRDGQYVIVHVSGDRNPGAYYLYERAQKKMHWLVSDRPWLDEANQLPTQPVAFTARDGMPITGFLTMPAHVTGHAPMVVSVHGGPFYVRDSWDYDVASQILAQHGYAVLRVNYRGSSGAGRAFIDAGARQWGAAMQDDITDATRWVITQGLADPARICIAGASYGGYAALMGAAREPSLYRCAVGLSGVYDLTRLYSWGEIPRTEVGLTYLRRMVGEDTASLAAHSPVNLAASITIPVLLAHGTNDDRVPVRHARRMRDALTRAGRPPAYVEYDYEGHGMASVEHRIDFIARLLNFLDQNIGMGATTTTTPAAQGTPRQ